MNFIFMYIFKEKIFWKFLREENEDLELGKSIPKIKYKCWRQTIKKEN